MLEDRMDTDGEEDPSVEITPQLPASVAAATGQSVGAMLAGGGASWNWVAVNGTGSSVGQNNMSRVEETPQQESRPANDVTKYFSPPAAGHQISMAWPTKKSPKRMESINSCMRVINVAWTA